ncbi:MAG TPA: ParB N-terminal domain-containing protein [Planctomycetota bacterium]|nr:ParB N-terminal domain-containing protein [Planctomycetota bacterium]
MKAIPIRPFSERKYRMVPVDRITVLNSRTRNRLQFEENIRSIKDVGLLKPIVLNERNHEKTGQYELVCGEGRLLAYKELGRTHIPAELISCSTKQALLHSLVENIARVPPGTMWFAQEIKRMHDSGWSYEQISKVVGKTESYLRDYVHMVEQGEERLIKGVEQGLFPMSFALLVARSEDADVQNVMMDAFDGGMVSSANVHVVRNIIEWRLNHGKDTKKRNPDSGEKAPRCSLKQLRADINKTTKGKEAFVKQAELKENRVLALLDALRALSGDAELAALLRAEGLDQRPELKGKYSA